ncbi:MAG: PEGA domain-containing protein [Thermoplasmata archaeon]|nr:PEGA domain-containing protein [Thermoplasmata archaeon]
MRRRPSLTTVALVGALLLFTSPAGASTAAPAPGDPLHGAVDGARTDVSPTHHGGSAASLSAEPLARPGPSAGQFPRNVLVDTPCVTSGNAEVQQAFDPVRNYLYEAWIGCSGIGFARSLDGGYSFQPAVAVVGSLGAASWDPSIALAPNGTVYVGYMRDLRGTGNAPQLAWSWNFGASFAGNATAFHPNPNAFADRDFIAVAPNGTVYLSWDYSPPGAPDKIGCAPGASCYFIAGAYNILVVHSSNGGANWSSPSPVDPEYPWGAATSGPLLVTPSGTVEMLYEDAPTNATHYLLNGSNYFTRSFDGGRSWTPRVTVGNGSLAPTDWWIDGALTRGTDGTLYAGFDDQNGTVDAAWLARSTNDGARWDYPIRVNPDRNAAAHIMVTPAAGEPGVAFVAWMTNNSTGAGWTTWLSALAPNGTALLPPVRISSSTGIAGYWTGDTIGLTYLGSGGVTVSWSYGRPLPNGTVASQVYAAVFGDPLPSAPTILAAVPGPASVNVSWSVGPAVGPVSGFNISWNASGGPVLYRNVGPSIRAAIVTDLTPSVTYLLHVAAFNPTGTGPFSPPVDRRLTAWGAINGTVRPASATVTLDSAAVPVVGGAFAINTTPGRHLVNASAPGYAPSNATLELTWNTTVPVAFDLLALNGSVQGRVAPPNAIVFWDGAIAHVRLDGSFHLLGAGFANHTLRVEAPNYVPSVATLFLPGNASLWDNVTLVPMNGTLQFAISPATASVTVDGRPVTLSPHGQLNLSIAPGTHTVGVTSARYLPANLSVTVAPGQAVPVIINLLPVRVSDGGSGGIPNWALPAALALAGAAVVVAAIVTARRDRRRPPSHEPWVGEPEILPPGESFPRGREFPNDDVVP